MNLPLPVAALVRRVRSAKSAKERHDLAYFTWEASIRLAVAVRPPADTSDLAMPSVGQWVAALAVGDERLDSPAILSAYVRLLETGQERASSAKSVTTRKLFDAIPAYRNQVMGHGAVRAAEFYDTAGAALADGIEAVWSAGALWPATSCLVYVETVELDERGERRGRVLDLSGPLSRIDDPRGTALPEGVLPRRVYLRTDGSYRSLHPFVLYEEAELRERVLFFNGRRKTSEFLDYVSGERLRGKELTTAFPTIEDEVASMFAGATTATDDAEPEARDPSRFGDYRLLGKLGEGGMGVVYLAKQETLDRLVALKMLPPTAAENPVTVARFRREIAALARCDHPNVIKILASGQAEGTHYYTMELVEGADLAGVALALPTTDDFDAAVSTASERVRQAKSEAYAHVPKLTPRPLAQSVSPRPADQLRKLVELFRDAARGVEHLHEMGILHRDLKPANLMVTAGDHRVVVMDLGLAALGDASESITRDKSSILGTLRYMPPEQLQRNLLQLDRRADVYSLGATFYELLAGRPLFDGDSEVRLLEQVLREVPLAPDVANPRMPKDVATIIGKAIEKDPRLRYDSAGALAADLEAYLAGRAISARPPSLGYLLRLAVRRHRTAVSVGTVAALVLIGVVVLSFVRIVREERRAETERSAAKAALAKTFEDKGDAEGERGDLPLAKAWYARSLVEHDVREVREKLYGMRELAPRLTRRIPLLHSGAHRFLHDGTIVGWTATGQPTRWSLATGEVLSPPSWLATFTPDCDDTDEIVVRHDTAASFIARQHGSVPFRLLASRPTVAFSSAAKLIAIGGGDYNIEVLPYDGQQSSKLTVPAPKVGFNVQSLPAFASIEFDTSGRWIAAAAGASSTIRIWDLSTPTANPRDVVIPEGSLPSYVTQVALLDAGHGLIASTSDGHLRLWDLPSGAIRWDRDVGRLIGFAVNPNQAELAAYTLAGSIVRVALATGSGRVIQGPGPVELGPYVASSHHVSYGEDGRVLAASGPRGLWIWAADDRLIFAEQGLGIGRVTALAMPSQTALITAGQRSGELSESVTTWNLATASPTTTVETTRCYGDVGIKSTADLKALLSCEHVHLFSSSALAFDFTAVSAALTERGMLYLATSDHLERYAPAWPKPAPEIVAQLTGDVVDLDHGGSVVAAIVHKPATTSLLTFDEESPSRLATEEHVGLPTALDQIAVAQDGRWGVATGAEHVVTFDFQRPGEWCEFRRADGRSATERNNRIGGIDGLGGQVLLGNRLVSPLPCSTLDWSRRDRNAVPWNPTGLEVTWRRPGTAAMSSDGSTLVNVSTSDVELWSIPRGRLWTGSAATSLAFRDANQLISGDIDGDLELWDTVHGTATVLGKQPRGEPVLSVAASSDGAFVASDGLELVGPARTPDFGIVWRHSGHEWSQVARLSHRDSVLGIAISPDSSQIATASQDSTIGLWRSSDGFPTSTVKFEPSWAISYREDGDRLAVGGLSHVGFIDPRRGVMVSQGPAQAGPIYAIAYNTAGTLLATGNGFGDVCIWEHESVKACFSDHKGAVNAVTWVPGTNVVISGGEDASIVFRDAASDAPFHLLGHRGPVLSLAFSPDAKTLASGSSDGAIQLWDWLDLMRFLTTSPDELLAQAANESGLRVDGSGFAPTLLPGLQTPNAPVAPPTSPTIQHWDGDLGVPVAPLRSR